MNWLKTNSSEMKHRLDLVARMLVGALAVVMCGVFFQSDAAYADASQNGTVSSNGAVSSNNAVSSAVDITPKASASSANVYAANDVNPNLDNPWPCPAGTTNVNKSIFGRADITICTWTQGIHGKGEKFYLRVIDNTYDSSNPHHVPDNLDKYYISGLPIYQNTDPNYNDNQVPYTSGSNLGWKYDDNINAKPIGRAKDGTVLEEVSGADLRGGKVGITPPADWTGQIPIKVWRADFSQNLFTDFDYGTFNYIGQIPDQNTKSLVCDSNNHQNCSRTGTTVGQTMQQNYVYHDPRTATIDTEPYAQGSVDYHPGEGTGQWAPHDGQYSIWPTSLMTGPYGRWGKDPSDPTVNLGDPNTWGTNWIARGFTWNNQWADLRSDPPYVSYGSDQRDKGDFLNAIPSKRLLGGDDSQRWGNVCIPFDNNGCFASLSVLTNNPARTPLGVNSGNVGQFDIPKSCISMSISLIPSKQCPDSNSAWGDMGNDDTIKNAGKFLVVNGRNRANGTDTIINSTIKPSSDDEMFVFRAQLANVLYVGTPKPVQLAVYTGSPSDSNNEKLMFTNYLAGDSQSDYDNAHTHWTDVSTALTLGSSQPFNVKIKNWGQAGYGNDFALDNIVVSPIKSSPGVLRAVRWTSDKSSDPVTTTVVKRGQTVTYKLTVTNNSESDRAKIAAPAQPTNQCNDSNNPGCIDVHTMPLRGSVLVDDVSDVMKDGKATWLGNFQPGSQASYDSGKKQIVWKVPDVPANGSVTLTYQVQMAKDPSGPLTIKNTVKALPYGDKDNVWVSGSDMESRNNSSSNWWERADSSDAVPDPEKCSKGQPCSTTHYLSDAWWNKVASRNQNNFLRGSEWKITGPDLIDANGNHADYIIVKDNVDSDKDGSQKGWAGPDKDTRDGYLKIIGMLGAPEAGKPDAKYKLVETRAPAGYQLNTREYTITIPAGKQADVPPDGTGGVIPNDQTTGPNLPFTGGISADYIILGGIVLTLIAALPAAITAAKRRRS
ncbi:SpaA isopeptide-forming pilin-related protein [Bifidobacterium tibiigranuli]|jgi:hypothetical protein|uniref:SpaA isopeptide-forming pilin-related protein n=1 Tax=Bifidobacterium tibiigranuli TaxID=2172043 RepID=UPI0026F15375|nr:SpaA isopeptide-forming pilin-related protein [Bifidobacterium tibiigranuli]MCI1650582.1 hypothetical protein [Bifidobacterium tibiigranuli]MCI2186068.1 hypothetical protein [Bifidobacterium tibiigranuli]MCI2204113.1 hypothetical protein [Bifidobacterium tibiigranuli]